MTTNSKRRRLLIASQPSVAGVPQHVLDLVESMDAERYEITVAVPRDSLVWRRLADEPHITLREIPPHREPSPHDARSLATLIRLVGSSDVVHGHAAKAGFLVRLAAAFRGRRQVCAFTPHAWSFWAATGAEGALYRMLERRAARWCRVIVALSNAERDAGLAAGVGRPEQYRVIQNGVRLERFAARPDPVYGRIVVVGRLAPQKRLDLALRAFRHVRTAHPQAELHVAGDGPDRADVETLVRELGLEGGVHLLGDIDDVPALLATAHCLLLTSDYEGCPLSVLEAMAAAVPVVARDVGGIRELVEHGENGLLVEHDLTEALAAALARLLADPERARQMGAAGRETARRRFSRERMASETFAVYDELVGRAEH